MFDFFKGFVCEKARFYRIVSICALIFMSIFMVAFASSQSFWLDELGAIRAVSNKNIMDILNIELLQNSPYNLPLQTLIVALFYHIMPYGEVWLLIPSIILVIAGIAILSKIGKLLGGEDLGFFTLCIAVTSSILITQGGWEIRPYALTFCFSSLTLLTYIKRMRHETHKTIVLYGISLLLLLYSHWFGSILALFYAFTDLYLWIKKRIRLHCIGSYILAGVFFVPWFVLMLRYHTVDLGTYWGSPPRIFEPILTVAYLLSNTIGYCLLFGIGWVLILIGWMRRLKKPQEHNTPNIWFYVSIAIVWTILPVFIYSKWINPGGSNYVDRYFFVILPHVIVITGYAFSTIWNMPHTAKQGLHYFRRGILVLVLLSAGYGAYHKSFTFIHTLWEPYREVAEYLSEDEGIYADDALVLASSGSGWVEYYFRKRGYPIPAHVAVGGTNRSPPLRLFIKDGAYINPVSLDAEHITAYTRLYLFEVHEAFSETFMETVREAYSGAEDFPQFRVSVPKRSFIIQLIKKLIRYRPVKEPVVLFGLRVFTSGNLTNPLSRARRIISASL
jgi:hypothetical protein